MSVAVCLSANSIDPEQRLAHFRRQHNDAGAIVSFTGTVRPQTKSGAPVRQLFLQHYPGFTEQEIGRIAEAATTSWDLLAIEVVHRTGAIEPGEPIVFVATAALHRRAAFEAADFAMDALKTDAPFWKKEITDDGEVWIEPRAEDHQDRTRWKK
ncbi:MAG: molybdenum cofactor biosynthesis protein MoaE [Parvularcula sp.]